MAFSASYIDNRFLKTFITTYQSFTTPAKLFDKLLQRYNVRTDRVDASRLKAIQLRVCVVLKYWVENQFFDFDEELIQQIFDFVDGTLQQNNPDLANMVSKELQNRVLPCSLSRVVAFWVAHPCLSTDHGAEE